MTETVMTAKGMLDVLLDEEIEDSTKVKLFYAYLEDWGAGPRGRGRARAAMAWEGLLGALPPEPGAIDKLREVLFGLAVYRYAERTADRMEGIARVRRLTPGTRVVLRSRTGERVVALERCKCTRFTARLEDGRLVDVPVDLFLRVADEPGANGSSVSVPGLQLDSEVS